jgi:hypothetical protein
MPEPVSDPSKTELTLEPVKTDIQNLRMVHSRD